MAFAFAEHRAAAAPPPPSACSDPRVEIIGSVDPRWLEPILRLCEELPEVEDTDPSMHLRFLATGSELIVEATLHDGRHAIRRVRTTAEFRPIVDALTTLPKGLSKPAPSPPQVASVEPPPPSAPPPPPVVASSSPPAVGPVPVHIEAGGSIVVRVAELPTYLSFGPTGYLAMRIHSVSLGLTVRWDGLQELANSPIHDIEMNTGGAGFTVTTRNRFSSVVDGDLGLASWVLIETQSVQVPAGEKADSATDLRLGPIARLLVGRSGWRWTLSMESGISPGRLRRALRIDPAAPALPAWELGLGFGASWGGDE